MPQYYDPTTRQPIDASPEDAAAGILSGKVGVDSAAGPVLLRGEDGEIYHAEPGKLAGVLAKGGYSLLSPEEEAQHRTEKKEGAKGVLGSLASGAESFANQALLGVPNAIREGIQTPEERAEQERADKYHQAARILGGAAGVGASLLYGGELFKGASLAGQAVERGILPVAEAADAGLGMRMAAKAADYATQSAALAAPSAIVQAALGDPKEAAETMLWGVGAGAVLGGGAELLGSAASAVGSSVMTKLGSPEVAQKLKDFAGRQGLKSLGISKPIANQLSEGRVEDLGNALFDEGLIKGGMTRQELGDAVTARRKEVGAQIGETYERLDKALLEPSTKDRSLGDIFASRSGTPTELADAALTKSQLHQVVVDALDHPMMDLPSHAAYKEAFSTILEDISQLPSATVNGKEVVPFGTAQEYVSSLRHDWYKQIGKVQNAGGLKGVETITTADRLKANAYEALRSELTGAANKAAVASGDPAIAGGVASINARYSKLMSLEGMARNLDKMDSANKFVSLTDQIHTGQGMASNVAQMFGAGIGGAVAGPAGAMVGSLAGKVPGMAADFLLKKWFEDKGLIYGATLARRIAREGPEAILAGIGIDARARLAAAARGAGDAVDRMAVDGLRAAQDTRDAHMSTLLGDTTGLSRDQQYSKLTKRLGDVAANPAALAQLTSAVAAPLQNIAPDHAMALQKQVATAIAYLHDAVPKPPTPPAPFAPDVWRASAPLKKAFMDKASIVADPMVAVRHMEQGSLTDAHIDALKTIYPSTYAKLQQGVLAYSAKHPDVKLPMSERSSVARFLGTPLQTLQTPAEQSILQQSYAPQQPQGQGQVQGGGQKPKKADVSKMPRIGTTYSRTQGGDPDGSRSS